MSFDPTIGRWTEADPDLYVDGANVYQLEKDSPEAGLDLTGQDRYVTGGASSGNPFEHSTLGVDIWTMKDGKYVKTGVFTYEIEVSGTCCSSSASSNNDAVSSRLNAFFAALSSVGPK
jgi:hypothetical protein